MPGGIGALADRSIIVKSLRICFVTQEYPMETGLGGIGTYTHEIARGLVKNGHRVVVLSRAMQQSSDQILDGVRVVRVLPKWSLNTIPLLYRLNKFWEGYRLSVALTLPKLIREERIDLVEVPGLHGEIVLNAMLGNLKVPYVVRMHSCISKRLSMEGIKPGFTGHKSILAERLMLRQAHGISAPSKFIAQECRVYPSLDKKGVTVIPNPIDCERFCAANPANAGQEYGVLFVGKLVKSKGAQLLPAIIQGVLSQQESTPFTIVGNIHDEFPGEKSTAKEWILSKIPSKLHERVRLVSWVDRDALLNYYQQCQVVIIPTSYESFGYTCLEAMACGKPVVAYGVGGINEILEYEESGVKVSPGRLDSFVDAVVAMLSDHSLRERIGRCARKRVLEHYNTPLIVKRMIEFYNRQIAA